MVAKPVLSAAMIKIGKPRSHFAPHSDRNASRTSKACRGARQRIPTSTPYAPTRRIISTPGTKPPR